VEVLGENSNEQDAEDQVELRRRTDQAGSRERTGRPDSDRSRQGRGQQPGIESGWQSMRFVLAPVIHLGGEVGKAAGPHRPAPRIGGAGRGAMQSSLVRAVGVERLRPGEGVHGCAGACKPAGQERQQAQGQDQKELKKPTHRNPQNIRIYS
jgi:hypothetical protein